MPETPTDTAPVVATDTTPVQAVETASEYSKYIAPDGKLIGDWKNIIPEDLRAERVYDKFNDLSGAMKQLGVLDKLAGKKGVVPPTDKSTPSEIEAFYTAIGRPQSPDGYKWTKPQDISDEDIHPEGVKVALNEFHKMGFTQKQAESTLNMFANYVKELEKQAQIQEDAAAQEAERLIKEESGAAYDQRLHLANRMITENTQGWSNEKREKFIEAINESSLKPYVMDMLANVAGKFMEHKVISEHETIGAMTPSQAKIEITRLEATPGFLRPDEKGKMMKNDGRIDMFKQLSEERDRLYRLANAGK